MIVENIKSEGQGKYYYFIQKSQLMKEVVKTI